jgi:hypothetical protein
VALADTVMALAANVAMEERAHERLEFKNSWYDPSSPDVPEGKPRNIAAGG